MQFGCSREFWPAAEGWGAEWGARCQLWPWPRALTIGSSQPAEQQATQAGRQAACMPWWSLKADSCCWQMSPYVSWEEGVQQVSMHCTCLQPLPLQLLLSIFRPMRAVRLVLEVGTAHEDEVPPQRACTNTLASSSWPLPTAVWLGPLQAVSPPSCLSAPLHHRSFSGLEGHVGTGGKSLAGQI